MQNRCARTWCAAAVAIGVGAAATQVGRAQVEPAVKTAHGFVEIAFAAPEGAVTAYLPDDIAAGETFSGTLEAPRGFALKFGAQRAVGAGRFLWKVPSGPNSRTISFVLVDPKGRESEPVVLETRAVEDREPEYLCPRLIQAGRPFPVRGPFDGDFRTTNVTIGGKPTVPLVESMRKTIVRAPADVVGPTSCAVTKSRRTRRSEVNSVSIKLGAPLDDAQVRPLLITGLDGVRQDIPFRFETRYFYLQSSQITPDGRYFPRQFRLQSDDDVELVIPQSRRDQVAVILRTPQRERSVPLAAQHAGDLQSLPFDPFPVAGAWFSDLDVGGDAAYALLAADEQRALPMMFESMPQSGRNLQRIGFTWFLGHTDRSAARAAHDAALRVLARIDSTSNAELAIRVVGLTGSDADFPLLERFVRTGGTGAGELGDASEASLVRLGSRPHLEKLLAELTPPLPPTATYRQALHLAEVLRKAGFAGQAALVPAVCSHVSDPIVVEIDIRVDVGRVAAATLSAIVDGPLPAGTTRRSPEEWKSFCQ